MQELQEHKKLITIAISKQNYQKLKVLGYAGDSFNDVLDKLLENSSKKCT